MDYDPRLAALAINFGEIIGEWEVEDEELFNKIIMIALKKSGYSGVTLEEVDRNVEYYMTEGAGVDIFSLTEYEMEMPPIYEKELY
jgi:hypothetical protein